MFTLLFTLFFITLAVISDNYPPEQIHTAVGWTPDRMTFNWLTFDYPPVTWSRVDISENADLSDSWHVVGSVYEFIDPWDRSEIPRTIHMTVITGLKASTTYYYKVGDIYYGQSEIYSFRTGVNAITLPQNLPQKYIIYGDLGVYNLSNVIDLVEDEIKDENVDTIIHVGDLAYDMYQEDGTRGDLFMNMIQPLATRAPYMVCPGNHEKYEDFAHYTWRFRGQPSNTGTVDTGAGPAPNNWYYSWNEGLVHWIAISTEIYFNFPWMIQEQWVWLQQDLEAANLNRTRAPWVIVYGHKQVYCSDPYNDVEGGSAETLREGVWDNGQRRWGLEQLFYGYGVDFYIAGHQHNYERIYDVYQGETTFSYRDMPATVYLNVGAAGAKHGLNHFKPDDECAAWSAVRLMSYGYSRFYIVSETQIKFEFVIADEMLKKRMDDDVWETIIYEQNYHGPFAQRGQWKVNNMNQTTKGISAKTVNLYEKFGLKTPKTRFEPDLVKPYISNNRKDYDGVDFVPFVVES